jgi:molybdopterin-containing oxidoreductase family iron-sulfur binding subunit
MSVNRRKFCKIAGLSMLGIAGSSTMSQQTTDPAAPAETAVREPGGITEPIAGKRWAMVVDMSACRREEGCRDCIDACHSVHNVPEFDNPKDEIKWIWKEPYGEAFPNQKHEYLHDDLHHEDVLVFCNHCDNPPCTRVCPTGATWKRDDGIVMMDWHRCIGCRYCMAGCPYGSRSFNWRDPRPQIANINEEFPTRTRGVVEKCTFCDERLAKGDWPACVEACTHGCLVFGDLEDPESPVRELLRTRHSIRRKPGLGTRPEVYYLV